MKFENIINHHILNSWKIGKFYGRLANCFRQCNFAFTIRLYNLSWKSTFNKIMDKQTRQKYICIFLNSKKGGNKKRKKFFLFFKEISKNSKFFIKVFIFKFQTIYFLLIIGGIGFTFNELFFQDLYFFIGFGIFFQQIFICRIW